jgi:hypothetical protein
VAGAALVSQWCFWDLAIEMVRKSGDDALLSQLIKLLSEESLGQMKQDFSVEASHMVRNILGMLRPHLIKGRTKTRVGRQFDGGYVMIDNFDSVDAAYSLGISDDVSWDLEFARRGIEVFQYDHTIDRPPVEHGLCRWLKLGVAGQPDPVQNLDTLANLIERNQHTECKNMLLKCDIDGGEWGVFSNVPNAILEQFSQIVVELHFLDDLHMYSSAAVARDAIANLTTSHKVVHVHGNNFAPCAVVGGVPFPSVLEVTFARHDQGEFTVSDEIFPTRLDMPCNSKSADHFLGRFEFSPG